MSLTSFKIRSLVPHDQPLLREFCEKYIARNYYSDEDYKKFCGSVSTNQSSTPSQVAILGEDWIGVRLTYCPGQWLDLFRSRPLYARDRNMPLERLAYFKTIFIRPQWTGLGLGGEMSRKSIEILKPLGCSGIITHSVSNFSHHNSSLKYLEKLGFTILGHHDYYWIHKSGLFCHICQSMPCHCSANEMYLEV